MWKDEDEQPIANAISGLAHAVHKLGVADAATPMGPLRRMGQ